MRVSRRELLGYAVAGTTGTAVTTTARRGETQTDSQEESNATAEEDEQHWRLGGVYARPAEIEDTAVTFRGSVRSSYDTNYEATAALFYRPKQKQDRARDADDSWRKIAEESGTLSDGLYLEATETGLDAGTTYQYRAEAYLTNYVGESHRVSEVREVTAGDPCSGPSTNCLRAETLAPDVGESGDGGESDDRGESEEESESGDGSDSNVRLRGRAMGLESYDEVTGRFFYRRDDEPERWTGVESVRSGAEGRDSAEFSTTLSGVESGTYTYYAEVRGEGGGQKNMYAEGEEREFTVE